MRTTLRVTTTLSMVFSHVRNITSNTQAACLKATGTHAKIDWNFLEKGLLYLGLKKENHDTILLQMSTLNLYQGL